MADTLNNNFQNVPSHVLADLGPVLTGERDLHQTAAAALQVVMSAANASTGALFRFQEKPAMLASIAASGFTMFPQTAVFPLLPRHTPSIVHPSSAHNLSHEPSHVFLL